MSAVSGKCDFLDHLAGLGGWFDRNGNPVEFGQEGVGVYYSDIMLDFIEFKKRTGGVIYQHKKIKEVNEWNQEFIAEHCKYFEFIKHEKEIADKRSKTGFKTKTYYTYKYYDKEYTAKEMNKKGVYITVEIHFDTLLELIPFFPYIVSMSSYSDGKATVYLSNESYVEETYDHSLQYGYESMREYYRKQLSEYTQRIVLHYFNPTGRENIEMIEFEADGTGCTSKPIDDNFKLEYRTETGEVPTHWTSPKIIDAEKGIIKMNEFDIRALGRRTLVYYVEKGERKIYLD